jgi:hypothetical protein
LDSDVLPFGQVATCPDGQDHVGCSAPQVGTQLGVVTELLPLGQEQTWFALVWYFDCVAIYPPQFIGQLGCSVVDCGFWHEQV